MARLNLLVLVKSIFQVTNMRRVRPSYAHHCRACQVASKYLANPLEISGLVTWMEQGDAG